MEEALMKKQERILFRILPERCMIGLFYFKKSAIILNTFDEESDKRCTPKVWATVLIL
jgi:hypothetical protein